MMGGSDIDISENISSAPVVFVASSSPLFRFYCCFRSRTGFLTLSLFLFVMAVPLHLTGYVECRAYALGSVEVPVLLVHLVRPRCLLQLSFQLCSGNHLEVGLLIFREV